MKKTITAIMAAMLAALAAVSGAAAADRPTLRGGAYYGTNYTVPFAHAYRALGRLGVDRRSAIDRDTYHMARLGLNAFRLHLWDVEISDADGNLIANDHLNLLDYLISRLKERNIAVVLTAQTNFGNGYPERNTDPNGAYSYKFEKCRVHDDSAAQEAQRRYLDALARHVNPYTGLSYADDPQILAMEINNEPCHSGTEAEITAYVDSMASTLRRAGWHKDILYNVSHNLDRTAAFYRAADIDGTTYQWYPTGLVKGERRRGNFLPVLDSYKIPFDTLPGFDRLSRVIYEYDPADVLDSYLYPAAARTFRKAGFDWVTQFAYDPIDMAAYNTEYQTHFLNLAYTPGKAIGMMIAAEVMRQTPSGHDYGTYPADTVFGHFSVSARRDLAMLNDGERYYHTNNTDAAPLLPSRLRAVAGAGSSPLVTTDGTGAYFADRLPGGVWRIEVMPDVVLTADPFNRPSLSRPVGYTLADRPVTLTLNLPGLPEGFVVSRVGSEDLTSAQARTVTLRPGVWLAGPTAKALSAVGADDRFGPNGTMRVGEYVAPAPVAVPLQVVHTPASLARASQPLTIEATVVADSAPDSVVLYPANISFWNERNPLVKMRRTGKYTYSATVNDPAAGMRDGSFGYNIVAFAGDSAVTFPGGTAGTPLDWDAAARREMYVTPLLADGAPVTLLSARADADGSELSTIPDSYRGLHWSFADGMPQREGFMRLTKDGQNTDVRTLVVSKRVAPLTAVAPDRTRLALRTGAVEGVDSVTVAFVSRDGFTYSAPLAVTSDSVSVLDLGSLRPDVTLLTPAPYPTFMQRTFSPDFTVVPPFSAADIETLTLRVEVRPGRQSVEMAGVWLE